MVAPAQPWGVWHFSHEVPRRPWWMSFAAWQSTHFVVVARTAARVVVPRWQPMQLTPAWPQTRG